MRPSSRPARADAARPPFAVVPIPPLLIPHGPADGAGKLNTVVTLPLLPLGIEAFTVYAQSAAVSSVGAAVLGAPSELTIL